MEIWKDVKGYEGLYLVSDLGRVKSKRRIVKRANNRNLSIRERILKPFVLKSGYIQYKLSKNGESKSFEVHRIVASSFLNHIPKGHVYVVDHIDNNKANNNLKNLQIITHRENCSKDKKGYYTGVYKNRNGKYYSQIYVNGKKKHLGIFKDQKKAQEAYNSELLKIKL